MSNTGCFNDRELDLLDAFIAGFDASAEGFNGEYVATRFTGRGNQKLHEVMIESFTEWRNKETA